jgi:trimeric autotransporter adhesin
MRRTRNGLLGGRADMSLLRRLLAHPLECALALVLATVPLGGALANPLNGQVAAGSATIQGQGTATVTVTQSSQSTIINWGTFNIGHGELTQFIQPNANAVALNRVTGGLGPSQIYGTIKANGKIFLVNPDGILFGMGSRVDTAGFLATTNNIRDADFMAGHYQFNIPGRLDASIVNLGHITATNGGFAALVAPGVRNNGVISANLGHVALASGNGFTLDFYGDKLITLQVGDQIANQVIDVATGQPLSTLVKNEGKLRANGGTVSLTAVAARRVVDSVINNTGVIEANSVGTRNGMIVLGAATAATKPADTPTQNVVVSGTLSVRGRKDGEKGGRVVIRGEQVTLRHAKIRGAGTAGGGTARIRGDNITVAEGGLAASGLDSLTLSSFNNINVDAPIVSRGSGAVTLRADNTGTGVGTVRFGEGGSIWTRGEVSIFYNPSNPDGASNTAVNAFSYTTPTDYSQYMRGDGALTAYMLVNTVYDLQNIQNNLGGDYALGRSIDASATAGWNGGAGFVPIGPFGSGFTGVFDGLGHDITGLTIAPTFASREANIGLFGINSGTISHVNLIDVSVTADPNAVTPSDFGPRLGAQNVGTIAGVNNGLIDHVNVTGQVDARGVGGASIGGLVGLNNSITIFDDGAPIVGTIQSSSAAVSVTVGDRRFCLREACVDITNFAGGLAGMNYGNITGSSATGNVASISTSTGALVGGLVAGNFGSISDSFASGNVTANGSSALVGGLVAFNESKGSISRSYASGAVSAAGSIDVVGGLVGSNGPFASITQSYATGSVTAGDDGFVGGLAGLNTGSITQVYASGPVIGGAFAGGLVGFDADGGTVSSAFWDVSTSGIGSSHGIGNQANADGVTGLTTAQFGNASIFQNAGWTVGATPGGSGWVIVDTDGTLNNANGAAGATRPMLLSEWSRRVTNAHQLELVNLDLNAHYRLANNINLGAALANPSDVFGPNGAAGFVPIGQVGSFNGTFNGQGHTITGLAIGPSNASAEGILDIGLFGINAGTIRNLHLTDVSITLNSGVGSESLFQNVGTLAAVNFGTIDNVTVSGVINGQSVTNGTVVVGGLVGSNAAFFNDDRTVTGIIRNSSSAVAITIGNGCSRGDGCLASSIAGGLVGLNAGGAISYSSATGNIVIATADNTAGGLVGANAVAGTSSTVGGIFNSFATGNVSSPSIDVLLGGLVGVNDSNAVIWNSRATGNVSATATIGAGAENCSQSNACQFVTVGGLVGENFGLIEGRRLPSSEDSGCRAGFTCASGNVTVGAGGVAGGLVGWNAGTVRNAFAAGGSVQVGTQGVGGGLAGFNLGDIRYSFATVNVTGEAGQGSAQDSFSNATFLGGLVGDNQGHISHAYASGEVGTIGLDHLEVGGLVAHNSGTIRHSRATGDVRAGNFSSAGGLVGENNPGGQDCGDCTAGPATISHSVATGDVVVGSNGIAGGLVAINQGTIRHSGAGGNVSGNDNSILGGLAGVNDLAGSIRHSFARGSVTGTGPNSVAGGLVGLNGGDIRNSKSRAAVTAATNSYVGGLAGINIGTIIDSHVIDDASVIVSGTGNIVGGFVGANMGLIDPSTTDVIPQAGPGNIVGSFAGANLTFDPSVFNGLTVPPPSFPAGTISADSQNTNSSSNPPPFTGTTTASNNPGLPGVVNSCTDALCQIFQTGFLTPSQPPQPPQPPQPSSPCDSGQGATGQCGQSSPLDAPPPPQQIIAPPTFADTGNPPTLVNLTTSDNGGAGTGGAGSHNNNNNGNNNGGTGNTNSPGPPPGPGLGRTLDEQRFSGVPPIGETRFLKGEVVVQISNTVPMATVLKIAQQLGITLISSQSVDLNGRVIYRFKAANGKDIRILIRALERNRIVASAQPNYIFGLAQSAPAPTAPAAPAAPPAAEQTGSIPPVSEPPAEAGLANANTAALEALPAGDAAQYIIDKMHLAQIHAVARGRGVVVAVIDSEIDINHLDLKGVIVDRFDATQTASHPHSHGTGMAGAIAAHKRLLGVAPGVRLIAIKAFDEQAASAEATSFQILKGLDYAIDHKARIINMSFAGPRDPMMERTLKFAHERGIILIAAAGNAGPKSPPLYPGADPNTIAVTASDYNDKPFAMANRGRYVAVGAPGVDVMVPAPGNTYQLTTGTSVATAHVSGVVALLVERKPTITPDEVRAILIRTATPFSARPKGEEDGAGLVDPLAALQALGPNQAAQVVPQPTVH